MERDKESLKSTHTVRSLSMWVLIGALLASGYVNFTLIQRVNDKAPKKATPSSGSPSSIPSFHLVPSAGDEHCPTLDLLGVTQDQRDQIRRCSLTSLDVRTDLAIQIEEATEALDKLLCAHEMESELILSLADEISSLRSQQYKAWISTILVLRNVLTQEQLQRLHEIDSH